MQKRFVLLFVFLVTLVLIISGCAKSDPTGKVFFSGYKPKPINTKILDAELLPYYAEGYNPCSGLVFEKCITVDFIDITGSASYTYNMTGKIACDSYTNCYNYDCINVFDPAKLFTSGEFYPGNVFSCKTFGSEMSFDGNKAVATCCNI